MERVGFIALRKQYGLTQADVAEAIGYSRQAVIKWEKGLHPIPDDVEQKLLDANLAAPATKKNAGKIVNAGTHPACYHADPMRKGSFARTLLHPKWWAGTATPFARLVSDDQWKQVDPAATVLELATYVAPTVEQAHALMLSRGITHDDASKYILHMGYALPDQLKIKPNPLAVANARYNAALAQWNIDHPDEPGWGPFEAANPEYRDVQAAPREQTQEQIDSFERFKVLADSAFANLNQTTNNQE
jgi:transcriptional regulator with XRE-family HTH domain